MDGVERVMVLGIFIVIVLILGVLAWDATHEESPVSMVSGSDGGSETVDTGLNGREPFSASIPRANESLIDSHERATGTRPSTRTRTSSSPSSKSREQASKERVAQAATKPGLGSSSVALPVALPVALKGTHVKTATPAAPRTYTVKAGDTAWKIAYNELGDGDMKQLVNAIQAVNPSVDLDRIQPGQVLTLPANVPAEAKLQSPDELSAAGKGSHYKVQSGDTLRGIAKELLGDANRWKDLYNANRHLIDSPNNLGVGMLLVLPEE